MAQFILTLIVGLALLTWAASGIVQTTAKEWFERDVSTRAQLVLIGASQSVANAWFSESDDLVENLVFVIFNHAAVIDECRDPETLIFATPPLEKNLSLVS